MDHLSGKTFPFLFLIKSHEKHRLSYLELISGKWLKIYKIHAEWLNEKHTGEKRVEIEYNFKMHCSEEATSEDAVGLRTKTRKHLQPVYPARLAKEAGIKQLVAVLVKSNLTGM